MIIRWTAGDDGIIDIVPLIIIDDLGIVIGD